MADKNPKMSFGAWFKNVYMYHYLIPTIVILILTVFVLFLVRDMWTVKSPDFTMVIGSIDILREVDIEEIQAVVEDEVRKILGKDDVLVRIEIYTPTLQSDENEPLSADIETGSLQLQALDLSFITDTNKVLFLFDEILIHRFTPDSYERLSDYGIYTDDDPFYQVNNLPVFKRIFVVDTKYYFALKGWQVNKKDDEKFIHNYDMALRVMNRLINEE